MGCGPSSEEFIDLKQLISSLQDDNRSLSERGGAITQEMQNLVRKFQLEKRQNEEISEVLLMLLGSYSDFNLSLEDVQGLLSSKAFVSKSQRKVCKKILQHLDKIKEILSIILRNIEIKAKSCSFSFREDVYKRLEEIKHIENIEDSLDNILEALEIEKNVECEIKKIQGFPILSHILYKKELERIIQNLSFECWKETQEDSEKFIVNLTSSETRSSFHLNELSPIMQVLKKCPKEKPFPSLTMFRNVEEIFDKKYERDLIDISTNKVPKHMTEFMLEHIFRSFGVEQLAYKHLSKLASAMKKLKRKGDPYVEWFCNCFGIFGSSVFPFQLLYSILKIRKDFHYFIEKHDKDSNLKTKVKSKKNSVKEATKIAAAGGFAYLSDVIDYVNLHFKGSNANSLIVGLKPPTISEQNYLNYRISHKIRRLGTTADQVFCSVDIENKEYITCGEFVKLLDKLDLIDPGIDIQGLYGEWVTKKDFFSSVTPDDFQIEISKASFLIKISEIFMDFYKSKEQEIEQLVLEIGDLNQESFAKVINELKIPIHPNILHKMYYDNRSDHKLLVKSILDCYPGFGNSAIFRPPELQTVINDSLNDAEIPYHIQWKSYIINK